MPVIPGVGLYVRQDPEWYAEFVERLPAAAAVAATVPLVHSTSKRSNIADLLLNSDILETSARFPGLGTWEADEAIGVGNCLYFYAGFTHPFGGLALVFDHECERAHTGWVAPFDTGGMLDRRIGPLRDLSREERLDFIRRSTIELEASREPHWRTVFGEYLAA